MYTEHQTVSGIQDFRNNVGNDKNMFCFLFVKLALSIKIVLSFLQWYFPSESVYSRCK